ncbi:MarR family winged helix-turn-helix transcriptional regulator [Embleya scabrispora]|uniref:MarR family winged helix-turn-helix transcriptional regulator n=1 Tax=Embleya scabrispora TaxID=159449 RepID=UPI000361C9E2|nr:MarR family transcriptional regulator [Embleya scabrispora]MYS82670.1 MarR family transcriptional regulator [Streptomyces sp. SID5474]
MTGSPARDAASDAPSDAAGRVWTGMRTLVLERHDRRRQVTEATGLSFVRVKALRRIAAGPLSMRELAARLSTDKPYTTLVVDDLERRGLIERTIHPADRRQRMLAVTPEGLRIAQIARGILDDPPEILRDLPRADLAALDRVITALVEAEHPAE